jgi:predicted ATPase
LAEGLAGATVEVKVRPAPEPVLAPAIPEPVTSLVGREREVEEIRHLLQNPAVRLVTLTGPGGGGKTRLAVDVARRSGTIFPGGVFFVDLGSINDPARFDLAVAAELQVRLRPGESLTGAVATAFRENRRPRTLVVLDSFEQLVDTAPRLTQLLQAVPDLTCLVTSRFVLHLTGEREFPVLPLPVPDTSRRPEPGQLAKVPSVALFLERAQSANPAFALDTDNAMAVAQICVRLDGLPLALELAAARVRALTPQALLSRLERRLPVLTTGARDLPVRQQTLRNTIEWSYDLLTEAEQCLLRRLAVFTGGCTLEAVEGVCDADEDLGVDALNGVSSLADKSLVQLRPDPDGDTRVTMLETIREYGVERLAESEDVVSLHRAHAAYYLLLAEDGNAALSGEHHDLWLRRFTSDHDNFRVALDWMLAHAQLDWGLRLGIALFPFWQWKEHGLEARGRLRQLAAMRGEAATAEWAKLFMSLGILHSELAEYKASADAFRESLAISRRLGDRSAEVVALNNLGVSQRLHGSYDSAVRYLEEALAILRGDSDAAAVARTLTNLAATCVERGDVDRSRSLYAEAFQIFERLGDSSGMAVTLHGAGDTYRAAGSFEDAESAYRRALDAYGALDDRWGVASVLVDLGALAVVRDQASDGRRHFREALEAFASLGYSRGLARVIEELSIAAARQGLGEQGLRLAGAAAGLRRRLGVSATAREQQRIASVVEPLRRAHGDRAWVEGRDLDQERVIAAARAATDGA